MSQMTAQDYPEAVRDVMYKYYLQYAKQALKITKV